MGKKCLIWDIKLDKLKFFLWGKLKMDVLNVAFWVRNCVSFICIWVKKGTLFVEGPLIITNCMIMYNVSSHCLGMNFIFKFFHFVEVPYFFIEVFCYR